jgi:hypothetical protein
MRVRLCAERFHVEHDHAVATHFDGPLDGEFLQSARDHFPHCAKPRCQLRMRQGQRKRDSVLRLRGGPLRFFQQQRGQSLANVLQRQLLSQGSDVPADSNSKTARAGKTKPQKSDLSH